jgi:hypothetical protein
VDPQTKRTTYSGTPCAGSIRQLTITDNVVDGSVAQREIAKRRTEEAVGAAGAAVQQGVNGSPNNAQREQLEQDINRARSEARVAHMTGRGARGADAKVKQLERHLASGNEGGAAPLGSPANAQLRQDLEQAEFDARTANLAGRSSRAANTKAMEIREKLTGTVKGTPPEALAVKAGRAAAIARANHEPTVTGSIDTPKSSSTSSGNRPMAICPDGSYVSSSPCHLCPNGKYVGGEGCQMAPDGSYVERGRGVPRLTPNGTYVTGRGTIRMCPDGSYVAADQCRLGPNGKYVGG